MRVVELTTDLLVEDHQCNLIAYAPGARFFVIHADPFVVTFLAQKFVFIADPRLFVEVDLNQPPPPHRTS